MEKYLEQFAKIYNTLLLVSTRGEDTVIMGQCLTAAREMLMQLQADISEQKAE